MKEYRVHISRLVLPLTAILLILISVYSYRKLSDLIVYNNQIQRNLSLQKELEKLLSVVSDAETGQRGFMLTNDSSFASTLFKTKDLIGAAEKSIRTVIGNDSIQKRMVDSLFYKVYKRVDRLNYAIIHRNELMAPGSEKERIEVMKVGRSYMQAVTSYSKSIQEREENALLRHQKETSDLQSLTPILLLSITLFSLILIIYSYFSITRELKQNMIFQNELQNKIEELNRSNSELEQFAYVASHDLQEPLRKIRSFGDRLIYRHEKELNDDAKSSIYKMQNAAGRMQTLIDDLLSFSRLVNVQDNFEKTALNDIVNGVLNDLEVVIRQKNAKIKVDKLPVIDGIPSQLRQLFQNLISNSLKFTTEETVPVIKITSEIIKKSELPEGFISRADQYYKISVKDNGIGFDEKYLDRIFVIFQRLHGKMEYGGTGIGLAVTKKIMNIHNGFITASSQPGDGANFYLFFPFAG